ncbi:dihydrolipoamide acetyltransferase family protein [Dyadobacter tibetensis]|uniref:dihydrolipoamide acetyltransferase family protein n=1 Tax=Dyadobacter tibetensis TaxID=1211851 RepID=UPI00046FA02D|nr:dihydrolipoamide acetyltransferase family protein [Dyadobacter tibetensis]
MKIIDMLMPPLGESILECTVLGQLKAEGEMVSIDESVLEVATDKVDTEVPCPYEGKLVTWLVKENDVVAIGSPVARIEVNQDVVETSDGKSENHSEQDFADILESDMAQHTAQEPLAGEVKAPEAVNTDDQHFFSPLVLSIAKEENIGQQELSSIAGTGLNNRLTKNDLMSYLERREASPRSGPVLATKSEDGANEIIAMDRMRKMIAQRMLDSKRISAHVTSFIEIDMTPVVNWRTAVKDRYRKSTGNSITFTPILIEAVVKALKDFPMMNISVEGDNIIRKRAINIGMAVALPDGNLIVPVIHHADQYSLSGLAQKVNELAMKARNNQLKADDLSGGTYTVSNIGAFGNLMGTPIIMQPQVGIMAFGAIKKKPAVIETEHGDLLGIRSLMFASHSYDHRVVDGSLGGLFLKRVNDYLENFDTKQKI